ncbi:hypothetical protein E4U42_005458, partial [Claviceps africana]
MLTQNTVSALGPPPSVCAFESSRSKTKMPQRGPRFILPGGAAVHFAYNVASLLDSAAKLADGQVLVPDQRWRHV